MKVDLPDIKSVKSGSTNVKKIYHGSKRLWPAFPLILLDNNTYYTVNGIVNNEYDKTEVSSTRCYLASLTSWYETNVKYDFWLSAKSCIASLNNTTIIGAPPGGDGPYDYEFFHNGSTIYFDYMANNSSGSRFNRLSVNVSSYRQIYDLTNLSNKWIIEGLADYTTQKKYIKIKRPEDSDYLFNVNNTAYNPNKLQDKTIKIPAGSNGINLYYVKVYNRNNELICFVYIKEHNGEYDLYDEIQGAFLTKYKEGTSDTVHLDKYVDVEPEFAEYYIKSGTITEGDKTYERLLNVKTGKVVKGIEL